MRINPLGTRRYLQLRRHVSGTQDSVVRITNILGTGQQINPKQAPGGCRRFSQSLQTDLVATHLVLRLRMQGIIPPLTIVRQRRNHGQLHLPDSSSVSRSQYVERKWWTFGPVDRITKRWIKAYSVQWMKSWWWTEELSETCRVSWQNKFVKLVQLLGFIIKAHRLGYG
jgi:hypothetical protein